MRVRAPSAARRSAARGRRSTARPASTDPAPTVRRSGDAAGSDVQWRARSAAEALGSRARLADALGVSDSQPTRWIRGEDSPNAENARAIVDLEYVVARARLLWSDDETVNLWLNGRNAFLGGARPIDVIMTRGVSPVVDALDQEMAGAFA